MRVHGEISIINQKVGIENLVFIDKFECDNFSTNIILHFKSTVISSWFLKIKAHSNPNKNHNIFANCKKWEGVKIGWKWGFSAFTHHDQSEKLRPRYEDLRYQENLRTFAEM